MDFGVMGQYFGAMVAKFRLLCCCCKQSAENRGRNREKYQNQALHNLTIVSTSSKACPKYRGFKQFCIRMTTCISKFRFSGNDDECRTKPTYLTPPPLPVKHVCTYKLMP